MITDDEFQRIVKYMKRKAGINLSAKRILIQGRLDNYLQKNGYESYSQFLDVVENCPMGIEAEYMLNALTTNHTYFWREHEQFLYLKEHVFPQWQGGKQIVGTGISGVQLLPREKNPIHWQCCVWIIWG